MHDQAAVEGSGGTHIGNDSRREQLKIFSPPRLFFSIGERFGLLFG
jgi:hypothetical protein